MPAWFLLPAAAAAVSAIGKYAAHSQRKPIKQRAFQQRANTGYLRKYMSDLQGRSASRARTELAMRPALRAIGAQQRQGQRQLEYQAAQQGLEGSGIEAQKQLALQAGSTQAVSALGEKMALSAQAKAQQLQAAREGQRMKIMGQIGQKEAAAAEANRASQFQVNEQFRLAEAQHEQQRKALITEGVTNVATSAIGGYGDMKTGALAADKALLQRQQQQTFQWDLMNAQNQSSQEMPVYDFKQGGVAGKDIKYYQTGGVAQDNEFVEFLSGSQGYQQALQNYQVQQDEAIKKQRDDKAKELKLYQSKLDQIADIETSSGEEVWNTATGKKEVLPLSRSKKQKIRNLKKETSEYYQGGNWKDIGEEVDGNLVLKEDTSQPYQLTETDSSKVAKDYVSGLFKQGLVTAEGLHKSFTGWKDQKSAHLETAVDTRMNEYLQQAYEGDVNSDEIFKTINNPNFMKSKNFKTNRTSLMKVLNDQQADIEEQAGAGKKVADKRGTIKRELLQNVHSLAPFLKTAKKIPAVKGIPATRTSEAVKATPEYYDIKDNFEDVLAEMKYLIAADDGGIPDATYDEILYRVKQIVDELTIPLSQLQEISEENRMKFSIYKEKGTGTWQIEGGDAKFKRTMVEELTKNLSKAVMWDDNATVEEEKDKEDTNPLKL